MGLVRYVLKIPGLLMFVAFVQQATTQSLESPFILLMIAAMCE